jgi:hypothetical protein
VAEARQSKDGESQAEGIAALCSGCDVFDHGQEGRQNYVGGATLDRDDSGHEGDDSRNTFGGCNHPN